MADTLKEFTNVTKTFAQLQSGVTVLTTGANEAAVLKDVQVSNLTIPLSLKVNGATVANVPANSLARLSGNEIIGSSSSVTLSTYLIGILNSIVSATQTTVREVSLPTLLSNGTTVGVVSVTSTTVSTFNNTPYQIYQSSNGDVYYYYDDGSNKLRKRAGGFNGTITQIGGNPSGIFGQYTCGDDTHVYGYDPNNYYFVWLDMTTGSTSYQYMPLGGGGYSYAFMAAMDRFVVHRGTYNANMDIINTNNGSYTILSSPQNPKIFRIDNAEVICDRIAKLAPTT